MTVKLQVQRTSVQGEVALVVPPGTPAAEQDRLLLQALNGPLSDAVREMGVVLAAAPRKYARPLPGKDAEGRTRFFVAGRVEGEALVPALHDPPPKDRTAKGKRPRQ
jgi:hypothetical protein